MDSNTPNIGQATPVDQVADDAFTAEVRRVVGVQAQAVAEASQAASEGDTLGLLVAVSLIDATQAVLASVVSHDSEVSSPAGQALAAAHLVAPEAILARFADESSERQSLRKLGLFATLHAAEHARQELGDYEDDAVFFGGVEG